MQLASGGFFFPPRLTMLEKYSETQTRLSLYYTSPCLHTLTSSHKFSQSVVNFRCIWAFAVGRWCYHTNPSKIGSILNGQYQNTDFIFFDPTHDIYDSDLSFCSKCKSLVHEWKTQHIVATETYSRVCLGFFGLLKINTFIWAGLAGQRFCWIVSTGLLDWVTWGWTQNSFCKWCGCYPPIDWASMLCTHAQKQPYMAKKPYKTSYVYSTGSQSEPEILLQTPYKWADLDVSI